MKNKRVVVIVDYGMGNILSVKRAIEECGGKAVVSSDADIILKSDKVILPGVGAFGQAVHQLNNFHLFDALKEVSLKGNDLFGICLGMQLLFTRSEEFGEHNGLDIIKGSVELISRKGKQNSNIKVPHIGWKKLIPITGMGDCEGLFNNIKSNDYFYFVHSFMGAPSSRSNIIFNALYEEIEIPAVVKRDSIIGCQFHPEKSGTAGLKIIKNWIKK
ncbi:imidazole glycerol phosphate synthase subunit HisH [Gammaproteobacteria bacterium]|nr:imidazole glycerol phosphate synthase subunit HisH [Gammaproteobacteria bacterium]